MYELFGMVGFEHCVAGDGKRKKYNIIYFS